MDKQRLHAWYDKERATFTLSDIHDARESAWQTRAEPSSKLYSKLDISSPSLTSPWS
ncbi:uncharacterized protein MYCFIDRAFT_176940 [Pseudocercospora fijiensis CIRAD86]|uniref:Uncharacterized protein n=1 Tax=Pseudocercospora fijiensis (strain CIRAD86) TaxID=383855 RepID=M3AR79_PSEFD|nr:uncharacterized protein MYCFIDRAFT_176940 [Pseudocercospora fijiensis CIRAD86]EME79942.1 hypothetical protein MYCFIDRAFT_176940 [Pseudocercospora fijiensis CIRAD86]